MDGRDISNRHYSSYRWGAFFERVQQCDFGWRVGDQGPIRSYHEHLRSVVESAMQFSEQKRSYSRRSVSQVKGRMNYCCY